MMSFSDDLRDTFPAPVREAAVQDAEALQAQREQESTARHLCRNVTKWAEGASDEHLEVVWGAVNYEMERRLRVRPEGG